MTIHTGDCVTVMAAMDADSVDAIVTDPPYMLGFMDRTWDKPGPERYRVPGAPASPFYRPGWGQTDTRTTTLESQEWHARWATAALRVAKPGAYMLAFGGTRTSHRLACAIEDAGWIIRDTFCWVYASGFPKSRASLKPAWEPIVLARKPGPLQMLDIEGTRIGYASEADMGHAEALHRLRAKGRRTGVVGEPGQGATLMAAISGDSRNGMEASPVTPAGRWPANVILTGTDWYTLTNGSQDVRAVIHAYFATQRVGFDGLSGVRDGVRGHASVGSRRTQEVLLPSMQLEGVAGGQTNGHEAQPRVDCEDAGEPEGEGDRGELTRLEGRAVAGPARLRVGRHLDTDGSGAGAGRRDGSEAREGSAVHPRASATHGGGARSASDAARGGPSPERGQGRQQPGEPVPPRPGEPHAGASDDRPGAGTAPSPGHRTGGRERSLTVPFDLIPPGWLDHFEYSHTTGVFDGGWDGVVGGGEAAGSKPFDWTQAASRATFPVGRRESVFYDDIGTYSRFFLIPKAPTTERVLSDGRRSPHPTQKPEALIRHLVRLVTPAGGTVLDPFLGSGTLGVVCDGLGIEWVGIEREPEYAAWAADRVADGQPEWMRTEAWTA